MPVFFIAEVKVTDDAWVPDYARHVHDIAAKHGGKYLSRSGNIQAIEGRAPDCTLVAVIQFPDRSSVEGFVADPDYAPYLEARIKGSESRIYTIDDTDLAGAVPYLSKG